MHLVRRDQDGAPTFSVFVGDVHLRQLGHDGATILVSQIRVQDAPLSLSPHEKAHCADTNKQGDPPNQSHALGLAQPGEALGHGRVDRDG